MHEHLARTSVFTFLFYKIAHEARVLLCLHKFYRNIIDSLVVYPFKKQQNISDWKGNETQLFGSFK